MIEVQLLLDTSMCLVRLSTKGHAAREAGSASIPCAAVSALVRTTARIVEGRAGIESSGNAPHPGSLELRLYRVEAASREWLRGITDFLIVGLKDIEADYPGECRIVLNTQEE